MNKYDGLYIFAASAKDEILDSQIEKALAEITRLSGTVLSTTVLGKKTFARTMHKRDSGVYVTVRFEMDPAGIKTLTDRYHLSEDVFRVQFLAVDERREAIIAKQKETLAAREAARAEKEVAVRAASESSESADESVEA